MGNRHKVASFYEICRDIKFEGVRHPFQLTFQVVNLEAYCTSTALAIHSDVVATDLSFVGLSFVVIGEVAYKTNVTYFFRISWSGIRRSCYTECTLRSTRIDGRKSFDAFVDEDDTRVRLRILFHMRNCLVNVSLRGGEPVGVIVARVVVLHRFEETIEIEEFAQVFFSYVRADHRKAQVVFEAADRILFVRGVAHRSLAQTCKHFGEEVRMMSLQLIVHPELKIQARAHPNLIFIAELTFVERLNGVRERTTATHVATTIPRVDL